MLGIKCFFMSNIILILSFGINHCIHDWHLIQDQTPHNSELFQRRRHYIFGVEDNTIPRELGNIKWGMHRIWKRFAPIVLKDLKNSLLMLTLKKPKGEK